MLGFDDFQTEVFPVKSGRFLEFCRRVQGWLRKVWQALGAASGAVGKASAPELWSENTWGCMEWQLHVSLSRWPGFGCIRSSLVVFCVPGRLQVVQGGVELRPWRSLEFRESPELQNGGLRALKEASDDFLLETFSCQVRFVSLRLWHLPVDS